MRSWKQQVTPVIVGNKNRRIITVIIIIMTEQKGNRIRLQTFPELKPFESLFLFSLNSIFSNIILVRSIRLFVCLSVCTFFQTQFPTILILYTFVLVFMFFFLNSYRTGKKNCSVRLKLKVKTQHKKKRRKIKQY